MASYAQLGWDQNQQAILLMDAPTPMFAQEYDENLQALENILAQLNRALQKAQGAEKRKLEAERTTKLMQME